MTGDNQHDATTEFNEALAAGFAARNFDILGPFYTEDASLMPPRSKLLQGRTAAAAFWVGVSNRFSSVAFSTLTLKSFGDAARRETGSYTMSGGDGPVIEGKYLFVWQLVDGEWQIETSIWNRNGEPGGRRQGGQGQGRGGQGGYRQGGNRPSFQQGGGGVGTRQLGGGGQGGGASLYDGEGGLYSNPKP